MLWEMVAGRRMWPARRRWRSSAIWCPGGRCSRCRWTAACPRAWTRSASARWIPIPTAATRRPRSWRWIWKACWSASADSHARNLGKVVSLAFEAERAERQALIERSLRGEGPLAARATPVPPVRRVTPAQPLQVTHGELTGVDVAVGEFQVDSATSFVKRPSKPPTALKRWRAVALASMAATSFAAMLLLGGWRRAPGAEARPASSAAGAAGRRARRLRLGAVGCRPRGAGAGSPGGRGRQRPRGRGTSPPASARAARRGRRRRADAAKQRRHGALIAPARRFAPPIACPTRPSIIAVAVSAPPTRTRRCRPAAPTPADRRRSAISVRGLPRAIPEARRGNRRRAIRMRPDDRLGSVVAGSLLLVKKM